MSTIRWRDGWAHLIYKDSAGKWKEKTTDIHESNPKAKLLAANVLTRHENMVINGEWDFFNDGKPWEEFRSEILALYNRPPDNEKGGTYCKYLYAFKAFENIVKPGTLKGITVASVHRFILEREKTVTPVTLSIDFRTLRSAFNIAVKLKLIKNNPFNEVPEPKAPKTMKGVISPDNLVKLLTAAKHEDTECQDLWLMIMTMLFTGLRRQEITHVRIKEDLFIHPVNDEGTISVQLWYKAGKRGIDWKPKDNEEREIPLAPDLVRALRSKLAEMKPDQVLLFPGRAGGVRSKSSVNQLFRRLTARAGLKELGGRVHKLRHTFITEALKTMPPTAVQEMSGHADFKTTQGYNHSSKEAHKKAMATLTLNGTLPDAAIGPKQAIPAPLVLDTTIIP